MQKELKKLSKDKIIEIVEEQYKKIQSCADLEEKIETLHKEIELYNYLKDNYFSTMQENERLNNDVKYLQQRIWDLEDLCGRQQKIIDSKFYN